MVEQSSSSSPGRRGAQRASVVIPAHDESAVIARTLTALLDGPGADELDVVVVCNGCTDDTADVARSVPGVRVIEIEEASKVRAVAVGNEATTTYPRVHLDADVEIAGADVLRLVRAVNGAVLAAGPRRVLPTDGCSTLVRAYYRVWEALPQVRSGLFGRGVIALSRAGQERVDGLPRVMSDDLAVSEAFEPHERLVVREARVVVHPPRTLGDLLRRRTRVVTGNEQATELGVRRPESRTTMRGLVRLGLADPRVGLCLPVFVGVGLLARLRARRAIRDGDFDTWLRDDSSRVRAARPGPVASPTPSTEGTSRA
jgi:glycosyltransferase involved in cell wall biosynthesis